MAMPIDFHKEQGVAVLNAIRRGQPIDPPGGQWNTHAMLMVAGAMHFSAMSHGPIRPDGDFEERPAEHREAIKSNFFNDLGAAIQFYSQLALKITDDEYDAMCEDHLQAIVTLREGELILTPVSGFKVQE